MAQAQSDVELMSLFSRGQRDAFADLVRRHQGALVNFFVRLGADIHGAEDCAQETFLRLFRCRDRYQPSAPFAAFLYTIARHTWVDWSRRKLRRPEAALEDLPAETRREQDRELDLEAAVTALPDHLRWVIVLSVRQGLSQAEVAQVLDIPVGTVKSRMHHAIKRLREALDAKLER